MENENIFKALEENNLSEVKRLLNKKNLYAICPKRDYPLFHLASQNNQLEMVKFFASKIDDIDATLRMGRSALFEAVREGHIDIVKYLVTQGASVNNTNDLNVPLLDFCSDKEIEKFLRSKGALNEKDIRTIQAEKLIEQGKSLCKRNKLCENNRYFQIKQYLEDVNLSFYDFKLLKEFELNGENKFSFCVAKNGKKIDEITEIVLDKDLNFEVDYPFYTTGKFEEEIIAIFDNDDSYSCQSKLQRMMGEESYTNFYDAKDLFREIFIYLFDEYLVLEKNYIILTTDRVYGSKRDKLYDLEFYRKVLKNISISKFDENKIKFEKYFYMQNIEEYTLINPIFEKKLFRYDDSDYIKLISQGNEKSNKENANELMKISNKRALKADEYKKWFSSFPFLVPNPTNDVLIDTIGMAIASVDSWGTPVSHITKIEDYTKYEKDEINLLTIKIKSKSIELDLIISNDTITLLEMHWMGYSSFGESALDNQFKVCEEIFKIAFKLLYYKRFNKVCDEKFIIEKRLSDFSELSNYKLIQYGTFFNIFIGY